jgi:glyoxylase-like metal-dependent hydrolase (beta-lactamase superfamily II)
VLPVWYPGGEENMPQEIKTITVRSKVGSVNCYLVKADSGSILIDTLFPTMRDALEKELENAGCEPGNLRLIVLTHGDIDHAGNGAYLRKKYGASIAIHRDDSSMVERGDPSWNRKMPPDKLSIPFIVRSLLFGRGKLERFTPDFYLEDGYDLSEYGFDAQILQLPGHSKGSVGILTSDGDLICGDLLKNTDQPDFHWLIFDRAAANVSVERLKSLDIDTVYPGHGKPFPMKQFLKNEK